MVNETDREYERTLDEARRMRWQQKLPRAESCYRSAIALLPRKPRAYLYLAETLMLARRLKEMSLVLRTGLKKSASEVSDMSDRLDRYRLAVCGLNYPEAVRIGERILDLTRRPEDLDQLLWPVFCNEFEYTPRPADYVKKALRLSARYLAGNPRSPWGYYFRGLMGELSPRPPGFVGTDLERVCGFSASRYGWMRFKSGLRHFQGREFAQAAERFRVAAAASDPGSWKAQCCLCECRLRLGNVREARRALEDLEKMISGIDPQKSDNRDALTYQGRLLILCGNSRKAVNVLTAAVELGSHLAPAWLGAALVRQARYDDALAVLREAAGHPFSHSKQEAMEWECEALYRLRRYDEVLRGAERLLREDQSSVFGRVFLALACDALGESGKFREEAARLPNEVFGAKTRKAVRGSDSELRKSLENALKADHLRFSRLSFDEMVWQEDRQKGCRAGAGSVLSAGESARAVARSGGAPF